MPRNDAFLTCQGEVRIGEEVRKKATSPPPLYRVGGCGGGGGKQGEGEEPLTSIASADQFGAWALGLGPAELRARLLIDQRGADLCRLLARAETNPATMEPAFRALDALPATDRRQILASYAALNRPTA
jgi:hypothetical protein